MRPARRARAARGLALLGAIALCSIASAQPERVAGVDQLKAAFVYNFTKYFTWPRAAMSERDDFVLCLDSEDVAGGEFASLAGQRTQDRAIVLRATPDSVEDIAAACQLWYVAAPDFDARRPRIEALATSPVLVVSDAPGSRNAGAVIELAVVNSRIQFRINTGLLAAKGLSASAFLLRLAQ
jgi:hypothetical protein